MKSYEYENRAPQQVPEPKDEQTTAELEQQISKIATEIESAENIKARIEELRQLKKSWSENAPYGFGQIMLERALELPLEIDRLESVLILQKELGLPYELLLGLDYREHLLIQLLYKKGNQITKDLVTKYIQADPSSRYEVLLANLDSLGDLGSMVKTLANIKLHIWEWR